MLLSKWREEIPIIYIFLLLLYIPFYSCEFIKTYICFAYLLLFTIIYLSIQLYLRTKCVRPRAGMTRLYVANAVVLCNTSAGRLHITRVALRAKASRHLTRRPQIYPTTTRATYCVAYTRTISRVYVRA